MRRVGLVTVLCVMASGLVFGDELSVMENQLSETTKADQVRAYYGMASYASRLTLDSNYMVGAELDHKISSRWSIVGGIAYSSADFILDGFNYNFNEINGSFNRITLSYSGEYRFAQFENYQIYGRAGLGIGRSELTCNYDQVKREYKFSATEITGLTGVGITSTVYKNIGLGAEARFVTKLYSKMDQELYYSEEDLKSEIVNASVYSLLTSITYAF